jgi:hypothetical protein
MQKVWACLFEIQCKPATHLSDVQIPRHHPWPRTKGELLIEKSPSTIPATLQSTTSDAVFEAQPTSIALKGEEDC